MAVRLKSLFNAHSNFMISVLYLDVAAPFNLFIYGDAALLTGSTRLFFTSLLLPFPVQHQPPLSPHPYMHLYWFQCMCLPCAALLPDRPLSPPLLWLFFHPHDVSACWALHTRQPPLASHHLFVFFLLHCNGVSRFVCAGRTWRGEDSRYRFLSCCFDWLWLSSWEAVEDVYDPEVPNERLLPCSVWSA